MIGGKNASDKPLDGERIAMAASDKAADNDDEELGNDDAASEKTGNAGMSNDGATNDDAGSDGMENASVYNGATAGQDWEARDEKFVIGTSSGWDIVTLEDDAVSYTHLTLPTILLV